MKVAVIQVGYGDDEPVPDRVRRVVGLVRECVGHDLVVLPELWAPGGFAYRHWGDRAESLDGPTVTALRRAALNVGVVLHAGSIVETVTESGAQGGVPATTTRWNTSVLLGPDGEILATYRKVHRFGFAGGEKVLLNGGDAIAAPRVRLPVSGGDVHLGLATCYDVRFPELFRRLVDAGAEVLVVPAAWPEARAAHWTILGQARAIENQSYFVGCNTAGEHSGHRMAGLSQIVSPTGQVIAHAGVNAQTFTAELDLVALQRYRADFPVLSDRVW
ncbi:MAG: nitrilase-related carbon-nitrogen hydrolase [Actinomycetota bacterium]